ncbi:uncharacterized protein V1513DRAFT_410454 [Lipomyces chichibuensis]|uniref:uncharacterized protein n=1 Tax=Lipomyces chichibuensis TaxID=1546026 RepID=UPI003343B78C
MADYSDGIYPAESSAYQARRALAVRNDIRDYVYDADDDDDEEPVYARYYHGSVGKDSAPRNLLEAEALASHQDVDDDENEEFIEDNDNMAHNVDMGDMVDVDIDDDSSSDSSSCEENSSPPVYPVVSSAMLYGNQSSNDANDSLDPLDAKEQRQVEGLFVARKVDRDSDSIKSWKAGDDGTVVSLNEVTKQLKAVDQPSEVVAEVDDSGDSSQSHSYPCPCCDEVEVSLSEVSSGHTLDKTADSEFQPSSPNMAQGDLLQSDTDAIIAYYFHESDSSDSDEVIDVFRTTSVPPSPPALPLHVEPPSEMPFPAETSVEDQLDRLDEQESEASGKVPQVVVTPNVAAQARYRTVPAVSRVSSVRSVSSGSSHTSYENAATFQSIVQGFQSLAHGQGLLNDEAMAMSSDVPDMLHVGRRRPSSGRQVFSTISTNKIPQLLQHNSINAEHKHKAYGKTTTGDVSEEQTPTVTKPYKNLSPPADSETTVRGRSRKLSVSSSSVTSDEEKENRSPPTLVPSAPSPIHSATFGSLRNRKIRPGGGGFISPTSPFAAATLKPIHVHSQEPFLSSSAKSESKKIGSAYASAIRRVSEEWRQQLIDGSLARILKHATGTISVAARSDRIQEIEFWLSEYMDVVIGVSCAFVIIGATLVGVLSFVDDTGRDYFGVRTMTYECALKATVYREVHECLVHVRLPSIFPLLGITASNPSLHWFIITDLYFWSVFGSFISIPPLITITGLALLSVAYGALAVLIASEKFLRWILGMTKRLMLEQIDTAGVITDIIDGTDEELFGDL